MGAGAGLSHGGWSSESRLSTKSLSLSLNQGLKALHCRAVSVAGEVPV